MGGKCCPKTTPMESTRFSDYTHRWIACVVLGRARITPRFQTDQVQNTSLEGGVKLLLACAVEVSDVVQCHCLQLHWVVLPVARLDGLDGQAHLFLPTAFRSRSIPNKKNSVPNKKIVKKIKFFNDS